MTEPTRPDVIVILTDEERAAPAYESTELATWRTDNLPGRQWFLDHGVDFRRHYVASTACVPSRPSLLTGQYPDVHGVTQTDGLGKRADDSRMRWLRPDEVPTIGHWFRAAGYDTTYVGKWHVSHADLELDGERVATNTDEGRLVPDGLAAYAEADPLDEFGFSDWVGPEPHGAAWADTGTIRDPIYADRAVAWLTDRHARRAAGDAAAARPFLMICSFVNPHDIVLWPILARSKRLTPSLASPPVIAASPTDDEDLSTKPALQASYRDAYYSAYGPAPAVRRSYRTNAARYRETYHRLHHDVDGPLERVRIAASAGGGDAVLVLSSDHGDMLGSHGGLHQKWYQLYDESTRVPFRIVRLGSTPSTARAIEQPTSHVDLLPTLLGCVGVVEDEIAGSLRDTHSEVHPLPGRDLSGVLDGGSLDDEPIYMITRDNMLEGDGNAAAVLATRGRTDVPGPLQIRVIAHAATNVEGVVSVVPVAMGGEGHIWKLARTFDDPSTWTEPGVRQLAARGPSGPSYRTDPIPDQWELYDLTDDPAEAVNRAADPEARAVRDHLEGELWRATEERVPTRHLPWASAARRPDPPKVKRPRPPARALRSLLRRIGVHPDDPDAVDLDLGGRRALVVATNHSTLDDGKATGVFASELTAPYYEFLDAGMDVDVASPDGGEIPIDPQSLKPVVRSRHDDRFLADETARARVRDSLAIGDLDIDGYDLVYFAGGWGAAWDLGTSDAVGTQVTAAAAHGAVLGGICHGPLGFLKASAPDGRPLVEGRRLTAVTDKQVHELGIDSTPQHPETELRKLGADFESASGFRDIFANHVVVDGDLVTGQNQNAGPMVAREMMQRVLEKTGGERT